MKLLPSSLEPHVLDAQMQNLVDALDVLPEDSEEYGKVAENLSKLYEARNKDRLPVKIELAWLGPIIAALIYGYISTKQVKMILNYEEDSALVTKALGFLMKPNRF